MHQLARTPSGRRPRQLLQSGPCCTVPGTHVAAARATESARAGLPAAVKPCGSGRGPAELTAEPTADNRTVWQLLQSQTCTLKSSCGAMGRPPPGPAAVPTRNAARTADPCGGGASRRQGAAIRSRAVLAHRQKQI